MTNAQNTHTTVNEERQCLFRRVMVYVALTVVTLIMAFPIIWMVSVSLKPTVETFSLPPRLLPNSLYLDGYTRIFENPQFRRFLLNSYLLGIVVTILSLAIGTLAAFGFSRYRLFGDKAAKLFVNCTIAHFGRTCRQPPSNNLRSTPALARFRIVIHDQVEVITHDCVSEDINGKRTGQLS